MGGGRRRVLERGCRRPEACPGKAGALCPQESGQGQDSVPLWWGKLLVGTLPWSPHNIGKMLPDVYGVLAPYQALDYLNRPLHLHNNPRAGASSLFTSESMEMHIPFAEDTGKMVHSSTRSLRAGLFSKPPVCSVSAASDPSNPITYVGRVLLLISKMRELGLEKLITVASSCN